MTEREQTHQGAIEQGHKAIPWQNLNKYHLSVNFQEKKKILFHLFNRILNYNMAIIKL